MPAFARKLTLAKLRERTIRAYLAGRGASPPVSQSNRRVARSCKPCEPRSSAPDTAAAIACASGLSELAIIACDRAEVIGAAIALQLLIGLPLIFGVCVTRSMCSWCCGSWTAASHTSRP
jgi:hypothetical protein